MLSRYFGPSQPGEHQTFELTHPMVKCSACTLQYPLLSWEGSYSACLIVSYEDFAVIFKTESLDVCQDAPGFFKISITEDHICFEITADCSS